MTSPKVTSIPRDHMSEGHQIKIKSINHGAATQFPKRARKRRAIQGGPCSLERGKGGSACAGRAKESGRETSRKPTSGR